MKNYTNFILDQIERKQVYTVFTADSVNGKSDYTI